MLTDILVIPVLLLALYKVGYIELLTNAPKTSAPTTSVKHSKDASIKCDNIPAELKKGFTKTATKNYTTNLDDYVLKSSIPPCPVASGKDNTALYTSDKEFAKIEDCYTLHKPIRENKKLFVDCLDLSDHNSKNVPYSGDSRKKHNSDKQNKEYVNSMGNYLKQNGWTIIIIIVLIIIILMTFRKTPAVQQAFDRPDELMNIE